MLNLLGRTAALSAALAMMLLAAAQASAIMFDFSSDNRAASVTFEQQGSLLLVTLDNISSSDVLVPNEVLTAVFFDIAGNPKLTRQSTVLGAGSVAVFDSQPAGGVVGGEWAYRSDLKYIADGAQQGISSTGLDRFGSKDRFPGTNLAGPAAPDGMQYGLLSAGDDLSTGNAAVTGRNPFVKHSVVFTFSALPSTFNPNVDISNVWFQYGTSTCDPIYRGKEYQEHSPPSGEVPEPLTVCGLALGLGALVRYARRRSR